MHIFMIKSSLLISPAVSSNFAIYSHCVWFFRGKGSMLSLSAKPENCHRQVYLLHDYPFQNSNTVRPYVEFPWDQPIDVLSPGKLNDLFQLCKQLNY